MECNNYALFYKKYWGNGLGGLKKPLKITNRMIGARTKYYEWQVRRLQTASV